MIKKKRRDSLDWIAYGISRVFDPIVEIPIILSIAVFWAVSNGMRWRFLLMVLIINAVVPFCYMVWGLRTKKISDWDITKREERYGFFFFTMLCHLFSLIMAFWLGKFFLFELLLVFWTLGVVFALVTFFWKISIHAGTNAALGALVMIYFGWGTVWLVAPILLAVLWSRVRLSKHTITQVITGSVIAFVWVYICLSFFN